MPAGADSPPLVALPQHTMLPSVLRPQAWFTPADTSDQVPVVGAVVLPFVLSPQHLRAPAVVTPQLKATPAVICLNLAPAGAVR